MFEWLDVLVQILGDFVQNFTLLGFFLEMLLCMLNLGICFFVAFSNQDSFLKLYYSGDSLPGNKDSLEMFSSDGSVLLPISLKMYINTGNAVFTLKDRLPCFPFI